MSDLNLEPMFEEMRKQKEDGRDGPYRSDLEAAHARIASLEAEMSDKDAKRSMAFEIVKKEMSAWHGDGMGTDYDVKREISKTKNEIDKLEAKLGILQAALGYRKSMRPWWLVSWWRRMRGKCPVCKAPLLREISGYYIYVSCPIYKNHYYKKSENAPSFPI